VFTNKIILYFIVLTTMISAHKVFPQQLKGGRLNLEQCIEIALKNNPQIIASD